MSKQTAIPSYFGKRKRVGVDDVRARAKKLLLDTEGIQKASTVKDVTLNKILNKEEIPVTTSKQPEIREQNVEREKKVEEVQQDSSHKEIPKDGDDGSSSSTDELIKSANDLVNKLRDTQRKIQEKKNVTKDLCLKDIKEKIKQSSKLSELKKSISKINAQAAELLELDKKKKEMIMPKIKKFDSIEIDVPTSPHKGPLYSPVKHQRSPVKPAYHRFASLAETSTLPLPFNYQKLYELFQAADTVCAMMTSRKDMITFNKLKEAVQEMTRKNFTTRHLGQIATVLPGAYSFHQEKVRNFGSTSKQDRYELVIKPDIPKGSQTGGNFVIYETDKVSMTPKLLKARKEAFYKALMERTKDCHEEFLKSLIPPITLNRDELKRWHPNFMVDHVPDVIPAELPQPPNADRPTTAKDVLERAKEFLSSNSRLQKALEAAAGAEEPVASTSVPEPPEINPEIKKKVDAKLKDPLKGISKSLLEKIRAKQAAKALDVMRMTPQQEKEAVMYTRLVSMARIVRTLFVNEQKAVLSWETIIDKVQFSYNRNLSTSDIEAHVKLLVKHLPEWLEIIKVRDTEYLKMNRKTDLTAVMEKLEKIVSEKSRT